MLSVMRRVVGGDPPALLGLDRFDGVDLAELRAAAAEVWGWNTDEPVVSIDPDRLLAGLVAARDRVARRRPPRRPDPRGHRPARVAAAAASARWPGSRESVGGHLLDSGEAGPIHGRRPGRGPALVDRRRRGADRRRRAPRRPGHRSDRRAAVHGARTRTSSSPTGASPVARCARASRSWRLADLDAIALGLARSRGLPVTVVPMHERRPASAYTRARTAPHGPTSPEPT